MSSLPNSESLKQENQTIHIVFSDARRTIIGVANYCCLTPNEQFVSHIMARTRYILMR
jgi:hypothetical protein